MKIVLPSIMFFVSVSITSGNLKPQLCFVRKKRKNLHNLFLASAEKSPKI